MLNYFRLIIVTLSDLIIKLANELEMALVFKLMIDRLLEDNALALLRHEQTQRYSQVILLQGFHQAAG